MVCACDELHSIAREIYHSAEQTLKMLRRTAEIFSFGSVLVVISTAVSWHHLDGRARLISVAPPVDWRAAAKPEDLLEVPGRRIAYWGDPTARYSVSGSKRQKKPVAVVVHFTGARPVLDLVAYGHRRDFSRGGHAFGYHFYIGRGGGIVQGAPLSRRTNHIKSSRRSQRRSAARHLWSGNTIGVSLVGGCDPLLRFNWRRWRQCSGEYVTNAQLRAGLAVVRAIQARYGIPCSQVYGHGDLQRDRATFEGALLTALARKTCKEDSEKQLSAAPNQVTPLVPHAVEQPEKSLVQ